MEDTDAYRGSGLPVGLLEGALCWGLSPTLGTAAGPDAGIPDSRVARRVTLSAP